MKQRFKVIPAVYLILIKNKKVLMMRRFNTGWDDENYSLPAGHLDGNEPAKKGLVREIREEIGLNINPQDLNLVHVMHRSTKNIDNERIDLYFTTNQWEGVPKIMEPHKCDNMKWFFLNNLPANIVSGVKQAIQNYRQAIIYSEIGWDSQNV